MASRGRTAEPRRPVPRLYLVSPHDADGSAHLMMQALEAADVAAVLLRLPDAGEGRQIDHIKALGPTVQSKGAALLLDGQAHLAATSGADGAHLQGPGALKAALSHLKPERIAGCGGLASRHDAMVAGEAGADYVMFGEPGADGGRPSFDAIWERIEWWADLFEIPSVGFAGTLDEVEPLALAGADFVAIGECVFSDSRGCAAAVADAARRLQVAEAAA